jgi:hypothetical protein
MRRWYSSLVPILFVLVSIVSACAGEEPIDCSNAVSWDEAYEHQGERGTVRGPVVDTYGGSRRGLFGMDDPASLSIGKSRWPDPGKDIRTARYWLDLRDRFIVFIHLHDLDNFPSYSGKTICVRGLIEAREGHPVMFVDSPSDIRIVE